MAAPPVDQPTPAAASVLDGERRVQLPLEEAARLLGISKWLAYRLVHAGELPTNRVGRNLYVPVAVLRRAERGLPLTEGGVVA
jgi:excisionase family DNA binding protein